MKKFVFVSPIFQIGIQDLRGKRSMIHKKILEEEQQKLELQKNLSELTEKLHKVNESIAGKVKTRSNYDKMIAETEGAYKKILESSQTLLHVLKRETNTLKKEQP